MDRYDKLMVDMDGHMDAIVSIPGMFAGDNFPHCFLTAEIQLRTLASYRYRGEAHQRLSGHPDVWQFGVQAMWPEGRERPGATGFLIYHLHQEDEDWEAWSESAAAALLALRERMAQEEDDANQEKETPA